MQIAVATLKSISPYSQSRYYKTDKEQGETAADYEQRTWRNRLHVNGDGLVFMPPMGFKNCLSEAAKYLSIQIPGKGKATYTKHFEAGVLVVEPLVLPNKAEDISGEWLFVPADGKRGSGKRVEKCFPVIQEWAGDVTFHVLDETVLNDYQPHSGQEKMTAFEWVLRQAGSFIGVGRFRPRNNGFYGRFIVERVVWSNDG